MKKKIELSACLIARDSEQDIAWCLEGLAGEVDEIIVVDTGSKDRTKEIAKKYTHSVYSFRWCDDFAAAKNFALAKARGQWVFFLDSDERITDETRGGRLRAAIREGAKAGAETFLLMRHEVDTEGKPVGMPDNLAVRVLKHVRGLRFHDPIHEYLAYEDGHALKQVDVAANVVALWHRGYAKDRLPAKYERNVALLEKAEREGRPKANLHYYLSGLYYYAERWEDVCRESELSIAEGEHPGTGALDLWRNYQTALEKIGDEARLKKLLVRTRELAPELPDTYARLAVFSMMEGDFAEGERLLLEAQAREAAFPQACPHDYDTFRAALPQVDHLLEQCRAEMRKQAQGDAQAVPETPAAAPEPAKPAGKEQHPVGQATVDEKPETPAQVAAGRIPLAAKVVVEFGCGRGEVGTEFLRRQPAARYYGVTLRHADAVAAAHVLTGALCGTPETADLGLLGLTDVDCIAFSPEAAELVSAECLRRHAEVLAADGQMVFARKGKMDELIALLRTAGFVQFFADRQGAYTVLRAVRQAMPTMSLQTLMGETIVTAFTRVLHPNTCLSAVPGFFVRQSATSLSKALAKQVQTSIVIRQRRSFASFEEAWQRTQMLRKEGFLVVSEIDDNPVLWQAKHEATRFLDFAGAHAVQTSTPALAEVLRQYNPHVFVFPNQLWELPEQRDYAAEAQEHGERVNIFFGALNREEDWQDIVPVLNRAAEKYGDKVFFRVLADRAFYDALATDAKEFVAERGIYGGKFVPYDVYARTLHASDISLLPLHDTEFNRTKSDLKFIESAGHGAVVLASPTVYEHTVVDGCTGCIYHDADEFEAKLAHLIEDAPYRHAIADAAYGYVRAHRMMSQHYMERVRAYRWLAEHKDELDEELAARLAKIRNQG